MSRLSAHRQYARDPTVNAMYIQLSWFEWSQMYWWLWSLSCGIALASRPNLNSFHGAYDVIVVDVVVVRVVEVVGAWLHQYLLPDQPASQSYRQRSALGWHSRARS